MHAGFSDYPATEQPSQLQGPALMAGGLSIQIFHPCLRIRIKITSGLDSASKF